MIDDITSQPIIFGIPHAAVPLITHGNYTMLG